MRFFIFFLMLALSNDCFAQNMYRGAAGGGVVSTQWQDNNYQKTKTVEKGTKFKDSEQFNDMKQNIKEMSGIMGNSEEVIQARNLLMLKEVLDFKMNDEKLAPQIEKLKNNKEFNTKLLKAMRDLDNKKNRNNKNQSVIKILNDAGGRIYNYLTN